jgi:hypothetical protein
VLSLLKENPNISGWQGDLTSMDDGGLKSHIKELNSGDE